MNYMLIENEEDVLNALEEFYLKAEYWKRLLGTNPVYFVYAGTGKKYFFGLSKFCAFRNLTTEQYINGYRYETNGHVTQQRIARKLQQSWKTGEEIEPAVFAAFAAWIRESLPNYDPRKARFISLFNTPKVQKKIRGMTPEELQAKLAQQMEIGKTGEKIAYWHEVSRLRSLGIKAPEKKVDHISLRNIASGFDIHSHDEKKEEERFIEVKSTTSDRHEIFLSENEISTLAQLGSLAYLYLVKVTDKRSGEGYVYKEIQDPIAFFQASGSLRPVVYKVSISKNK